MERQKHDTEKVIKCKQQRLLSHKTLYFIFSSKIQCVSSIKLNVNSLLGWVHRYPWIHLTSTLDYPLLPIFFILLSLFFKSIVSNVKAVSNVCFLTLYTLTSVSIFSMLLSTCFFGTDKENSFEDQSFLG